MRLQRRLTATSSPELRADFIPSHLIGTGLGRYVLMFEPLASIDRADVVEVTGAILQRLLTGALR